MAKKLIDADQLRSLSPMDGLKHDKAYVSITLFDAAGEALESKFSPAMTTTCFD